MDQLLAPYAEVRQVFDAAAKGAELDALFGSREANTLAIGRLFREAKAALPRTAYNTFVEARGQIPITAEVFIAKANKADGILPQPAAPRKQVHRWTAAEILGMVNDAESLEEVIELLRRADAETA